MKLSRRQLLTGSAAAAVAAVIPAPKLATTLGISFGDGGFPEIFSPMTSIEVEAFRDFQAEEIARIFMVPGGLMRDSLLINGEPPADPYISWMKHTVGPWLERIQTNTDPGLSPEPILDIKEMLNALEGPKVNG